MKSARLQSAPTRDCNLQPYATVGAVSNRAYGQKVNTDIRKNPIILAILSILHILLQTSGGNPATISTVSKLTVITEPINDTIADGFDASFASFTIPLFSSVLTRY